MQKEEIKDLLDKYYEGLCSPEEKLQLEVWYFQQAENDTWDLQGAEMEQTRLRMLKQLNRRIEAADMQPLKLNPWWRVAIAAALVLVFGTGLWFYLHQSPEDGKGLYANDVSAGKNIATLTLADGKTIVLSDTKQGIVIDPVVLAYNDGTAIPDAVPETNARTEMLTASTPRGGTYQITLADGTRVWLNAASSLSFPQTFKGIAKRLVKLTGEAYFEVAEDKQHPFLVQSTGQEVEVVGTHFNINSYADEAGTKTTLFKGAVKVWNDKESRLLLPGQQSQTFGKELNITNQVDLDDVMAWKLGYFKFDENLKGIMAKISRWYDVSISYHPDVNLDQTFSGEISRTRNLSAVLKIMEATGNVHFKIEGRRVSVMP